MPTPTKDRRYTTKREFFGHAGMLVFLIFLLHISWMMELQSVRWPVFYLLIILELVFVVAAIHFHRLDYTDKVLGRASTGMACGLTRICT